MDIRKIKKLIDLMIESEIRAPPTSYQSWTGPISRP